MDAINKMVGCLVNPLLVGIILIVIAALLLYKNRATSALRLLLIDALWFWCRGMPIAEYWLAVAFAHNNASLHEHIGYWGYKWLRRC